MKFRRDIEGLRAIAVLLVVLFHAQVPGFSGGFVGVDVFLVVSGYLITELIIQKCEAESFSLPRFYARRVRRLLPASSAALVGTAVLTHLFLPVTRVLTIAEDIQWASLYVANWRFSTQAVDYWAADSAPSPVQHFWSLSVEEQFYFVWPVLIAGVMLAARAARFHARIAVTTLLCVVTVLSFTYSLFLTATDPAPAYFVTTTRIWQLSLGGLLSASSAGAKGSKSLASWFAIFGLLLISIATTTYDSSTVYPGSAASLPTFGAGLLLLAGSLNSDHVVAGVLSSKPALWVGARSYSIYLWHWIFIVIALTRRGQYSWLVGLGFVAISLVPAIASYQLIESPARRSERFGRLRFALPLSMLLTAIGFLAGTGLASTV